MKTAISWAQTLYERIFNTELLRRIVRNSSYLVVAAGLTSVFGVIQTGYVTRLIGVELFGLFGSIRTFSNIINRFTSFRISEMVVRNVRYFEETGEGDKAAATYKLAALLELLGALVAFALIWVLAPWGARFFGQDETSAPFWTLYGLVVLINFVYESSTGLLQVFDRFRDMSLINTLQSIVTLGLAVYVYYTGGGLYEVIWVYVIGKAVGALGIMWSAFRAASANWGAGWWRTPLSALGPQRGELLRFSFSTNLSSTISIVAKDSELLWVSGLLGTEAAGYYGLALYFINLMKLPIGPLPLTTYPELSREISRSHWDTARGILRRGSSLAAAYSLPVALGLLALGQPLILRISGESYLPAYPILAILLAGYTFDNIFFWNRVALLALNRPIFPTVVNFLAMLLKVAGLFLLVPVFGVQAIAALLSGYFILTVGSAAWRVYRDLDHRLAEQAA